MEEAVLDYPLWKNWTKSLINLPAKIKARSHSDALSRSGDRRNAGSDRTLPTTRYGLVELEPKTGRKHQLADILPICVIRLLAIANMAI